MKVLEQRIPSGFIDMNRQALELGLELGISREPLKPLVYRFHAVQPIQGRFSHTSYH
jgi:hypothetical protein